MVQIVLLRGINVGAANRIGMPVLREALSDAGFADVRTHLQSGNVLADGDPDALVAAIRAVIDVPCVLRSADQLDAVIAANPFAAEAAADPKLLQVTFRSEPATPALAAALEARRAVDEKLAVIGSEIYSWHPRGMGRSKLAAAAVPRNAAATARNWNTVVALAELARA